MNFDEMKEKATDFAEEHSDKVEEGLDKAGEQAKERFGHEDQVDSATEKAGEYLTGGGDGGEEQGQ
jgi:hypothetical protein